LTAKAAFTPLTVSLLRNSGADSGPEKESVPQIQIGSPSMDRETHLG
jgi:hypothetical protein